MSNHRQVTVTMDREEAERLALAAENPLAHLAKGRPGAVGLVAKLRTALQEDEGEAPDCTCDLGWSRIGERTWVACVVCHPEWVPNARSTAPTVDDCEPEPAPDVAHPHDQEAPCENCSGDGTISVSRDESQPTKREHVECNRCSGTGLAKNYPPGRRASSTLIDERRELEKVIDELEQRAKRADNAAAGSTSRWFVGNAYGLREAIVLLRTLAGKEQR